MNDPAGLRVARLTPAGRGGVASILVDGKDAVDVVARSLHGAAGERLARSQQGAIVVGRWNDAAGEEVVVALRGGDRVEIHCHGGAAAVEAVIEALTEAGAVRVGWPDAAIGLWPSAASAKAATLLASAVTERVAAIALDQFHGALAREAQAIVALLATGDVARARDAMDVLCQRGQIGERLSRPFRIVVGGPTNAGKSTLVNALLGYQRSIVGPQPGVTRDVLTAAAALDGWPVELCDTAGRRFTADPIEASGVALAEAAANGADVVLFVFDRSAPWCDESQRLLDTGNETGRIIVVHNKCDLAPADSLRPRPPGLAVSAAHGEGLAKLEAEIVRQIAPVEFPTGCGAPIVASQLACCQQALLDLQHGSVDGAAAALRALCA